SVDTQYFLEVIAITLAICWHSYYGQCCRSDRMGLSPQFSQTFIHRSDQVYSPVGSHSKKKIVFDNIIKLVQFQQIVPILTRHIEKGRQYTLEYLIEKGMMFMSVKRMHIKFASPKSMH